MPGGPPALLISEAVRGEGAVLVDAAGYRFMPDYHPDAELAPRDVVSRSIALQLAARGPHRTARSTWTHRGIEAPGAPASWPGGSRPSRRPPSPPASTGPRAGARRPGIPLLDGRGVHRPPGPDVRAWALCRRGSGLHGCRGPTGWRRTPCWRGWSSPAAPSRTSCAHPAGGGLALAGAGPPGRQPRPAARPLPQAPAPRSSPAFRSAGRPGEAHDRGCGGDTHRCRARRRRGPARAVGRRPRRG